MNGLGYALQRDNSDAGARRRDHGVHKQPTPHLMHQRVCDDNERYVTPNHGTINPPYELSVLDVRVYRDALQRGQTSQYHHNRVRLLLSVLLAAGQDRSYRSEYDENHPLPHYVTVSVHTEDSKCNHLRKWRPIGANPFFHARGHTVVWPEHAHSPEGRDCLPHSL